ncbi:DUF4197 family protein [Campylobacter sputorum]|uniref:DUF4197 family protein n=1 Tax=Campylobacter sputorum TaxID=206 RepID=UPI00053BF92C|nr:DUF4197 family protein [Campylobacter sputorum]
MKKLIFVFILAQSFVFASWDMAISNAMISLKSYYTYDVANYKKSLLEVIKQSEEAILNPKNGDFIVNLPKKSSEILKNADKNGRLNDKFSEILNLVFKQNVTFISQTLQKAISSMSNEQAIKIMNGELLSKYLKNLTYLKLNTTFKNSIKNITKKPEYKHTLMLANKSKSGFENYLVDDFLNELFEFLQNNEKDFINDPFGFSANKVVNLKK